MDNLAVLAERYLKAVESGDKFAHARGLELAEAVLKASGAVDDLLDAGPGEVPTDPVELEWRLEGKLGDDPSGVLAKVAERLLEEGRVEGKRAMLSRQLKAKFGKLPDDVVMNVAAAGVNLIDAWAERLLAVASLAEVFRKRGPSSK